MEESLKEKRVRILMTTDTVGGVWTYSIELCRSLQPLGVCFYLITTGAPMQPAQRRQVEELDNVTVYETDFMLEWMENPWPSIDASGDWLLQLEEELEPDLVHINGFAYGSLPWKAPKIVVAHSDVFSWWIAVKGQWPPAEWNHYFERIQAGLQQADHIIAPSVAMMDQLRRIYSFDTPGQVIYNWSNPEKFYRAGKEPVVFSMGRIWDEAKNIQLLLKAAPQIKAPIRLAGDHSFASNHCDLANTNISYLGKLPAHQIAACLSTASVFVLPALYEPFGLSALEAALSGCALVLGNIDSLKEIWGESAIYVNGTDPQALADTVNALMEGEPMRLQYAQRAAERAKRYTSTAMAGQYKQVYTRLVQQKNLLLQQEIM
ncbi:MAG: glycosyltransferase family 4 protein [Williamsia sp.]|nr:glycosyltransferase family 4 protein [Williamsia sp.]